MSKLEVLKLIRWILRELHQDYSLRNAIRLYDEYMERNK